MLAAGGGTAAGRALSDAVLDPVWRAGDGAPAGDIAAARHGWVPQSGCCTPARPRINQAFTMTV
jgi:hypothetical protein